MELFNELKQSYPMFQIVVTVFIFIFFLILRKILSKLVNRRAIRFSFDETRSLYVRNTVRAAITMVMILFVGMVWEISFEGLSLYIASFITIIGVGLFANWSIVSNITASVILFFFFPLKLGSNVRIVDGENSAEGVVMGLSLFSILIQNKEGNDIYFPNNLAIQKSIVHLK